MSKGGCRVGVRVCRLRRRRGGAYGIRTRVEGPCVAHARAAGTRRKAKHGRGITPSQAGSVGAQCAPPPFCPREDAGASHGHTSGGGGGCSPFNNCVLRAPWQRGPRRPYAVPTLGSQTLRCPGSVQRAMTPSIRPTKPFRPATLAHPFPTQTLARRPHKTHQQRTPPAGTRTAAPPPAWGQPGSAARR